MSRVATHFSVRSPEGKALVKQSKNTFTVNPIFDGVVYEKGWVGSVEAPESDVEIIDGIAHGLMETTPYAVIKWSS
jgi:predicted DNA-binding transcriptional regulator